jgi:choline monooxygenase
MNADHQVDADIAKARTLPASAFTAPAFLERELATIFASSWLLAPPSLAGSPLAELLAPGRHAPVSLLGKPVLLRRDTAGKLQAFPNVCTHAWHTLAPSPGASVTVACPQHGRVFDGDGRCIAHKGFGPDFPGPEDHLAQLPVESWGPLVFVALGGARPFESWLAPVKASLGKLALEAFEPRPHADEVREVEGNWKLHAWNFMDTFHIPYIHHAPNGLADAVDLGSYKTELHDGAALQWAFARDPRNGFDPELLPERFREGTKRVFALWWFLFPNVTLNFYPWGLSVNVYEPVPGVPDRTRFLWMHLVRDEALYEEREGRWFVAKVDAEDVAALGQVRLGAGSGFARRGRFAPGAEAGPHWFHRLVSLGVSS